MMGGEPGCVVGGCDNWDVEGEGSFEIQIWKVDEEFLGIGK